MPEFGHDLGQYLHPKQAEIPVGSGDPYKKHDNFGTVWQLVIYLHPESCTALSPSDIMFLASVFSKQGGIQVTRTNTGSAYLRLVLNTKDGGLARRVAAATGTKLYAVRVNGEAGYHAVKINGVAAAKLLTAMLPHMTGRVERAERALTQWHARTPSTPPVKHGLRSRYTKGCRCVRCTAANRRYQRARYKPTGQDENDVANWKPVEPEDISAAVFLGR